MEKITNRDLYFRDFIEFKDLVELNAKLVADLREHPYFCDDMTKVVEKLATDSEKLVFILVWFTRSRSTCGEFIRLLAESGQKETAQRLLTYNTSKGHNVESGFRICPEIEVQKARSPMMGSLYYKMDQKPRGKCIILNNVPKECHMESNRFKYIFEKLHFQVIEGYNWTAKQMVINLREIIEKEDKSCQALVVMIISHGLEEKIMGSDACDAMRVLGDNANDTAAKRVLDTDVVDIRDIVDLCSVQNCPELRNIPKLFFFTCCRNSLKREMCGEGKVKGKNLAIPFIEVAAHPKRHFPDMQSLDKQWVDNNMDTFICYSCAEGHKTFYDEEYGISHFGQAFSHTIAQYACEETLTSIMSRTCDFLQLFVEQTDANPPEFRGKGLRRQLCFNP
ncbi:unnamed protein product [Medioppia subpectinata]|uniref:Caspase family p20 domain-containing protein n=1 Tax=Medioppia subpectinata TaxID=1979941 RepID=A0A7R9KJ29_9ACAR|nr:unnamed protein product [Medioppia subpectinata]CAG2103091.1 unnamed protein product [Medioppia subpectinata]